MHEISDLVPMAHTADVDRSVAFYQRLGFELLGSDGHDDHLHWASMGLGPARLMLTGGEEPLEARQRDVVFYLYSPDVATVHAAWKALGVEVSEISCPPHLPNGEFHVTDPDGYLIFIGQR